MKNEKLVSVIIPVYNVENYLKKTIECVFNQTYQNFELLLIDDGSKDSSGAICDEAAAKSEKVRVFHNENQGPAKTRNFGIEQAEGEYIAFVDSDDLITKDYLESMITCFEYPEVDLILCGYERFDSATNKTTSTHLVGDWSCSLFMSNRELARLFTVPKTSLNGVSIWAKLYKRDIIMDNNIRFPENVDYEEDCCFNVLYYRHVRKSVAVNRSMYRYRQLGNSLSKVYKESTYRNLVNGYNERMKFIKEFPNPKQLCDGINTVFLVVTISNLKKIATSPMTKEEKRKAYENMLEFQEMKDVVDNCALSKVKLTRKLTLACRERNAKKLEKILDSWITETKIREKISKIIKKFRRK